MPDKRRSVIERLRQHGLRVVCAACGTEQRHMPQAGRLRKARCQKCSAPALRPVHWIKLMPARWSQLVSEQAAIRSPWRDR